MRTEDGEEQVEGEARPSQAPTERLDARVRWLWTLWAVVAALGVTLVAGFAAVVLASPTVGVGLGGAILAVGLGLAVWYPGLAHRRWRYRLTDLALELHHGVVLQVDAAVPYLRIQHIDVTQGPVERALGLVSLVVHTAAASADATLPGIPAATAEEVRHRLLTRTVAAAELDEASPDAV